jgi:hypothetical protein
MIPFTPYFPALRSKLAAVGRRSVTAVRQMGFAPLAEQLRQLLPPELLASAEEGPNSRFRFFPLRRTVECFAWQRLKPGTSNHEVTLAVKALAKTLGEGDLKDDTGAYSTARQRVPKERIVAAVAATAATASQRVPGQGDLKGRPVKVVDCSTVKLADTAANQKRFPQPTSQKPGCGFPVMKFLALFDLGSGAISQVVTAPWARHDLRLLNDVWAFLNQGDIMLGDRAYADYVSLATGPRHGVDVLARLPATRKVDFKKPHQRLGRKDALFVWEKGYQQSKRLTPEEWSEVPERITVRVLRFEAIIRGRKQRVTLVTTLLDAMAYPARELIALFARRWNLELALRHLKTTMGMEHLRCKSPDMAEKELLAYILAYNMVRCLMAEAVVAAGVEMERASFKGSIDAIRQYTFAMAGARSMAKKRELWDELLAVIASHLVPSRPGRREPRAVKRRPKPYPLLNKPRHQYIETPHRSRYRKNKVAKNIEA